jgi:hypothetical protein
MTRLFARALTVATLCLFVWGLVAVTALAAEGPKIVGAHLGLGDGYKVGFWAPLRVTVKGGDAPVGVTVMAITPDSDGVGVATSTPGARPLSTQPGAVSEENLYVRIGQQEAPIEVRIYADGRQVHRRVFSSSGGDPEMIKSGEELPLASSTTDRLFVQLGADTGVGAESETADYGSISTAATLVTDADDLPRDAIGYDGVDAVVLVTGSRSGDVTAGWMGGLTASDAQIQALAEWVRGGGRLVLSCGAASATMLAEGGPLAEFLPGDYAGPSTIADTSAIERFADASSGDDIGAINQGVGTLNLALIENPRGVVLAHAGRTASETPLVIRAPLGFGEVTFVAFDLDSPAIIGWNGRAALMRQLLRLPMTPPTDSNQYGGWWRQQDLVNNLLAKLDDEFIGVRTTPFLAIVGLVVLYLLLIGPGDYFFVKNVLRRVEATWVTFPILVAATSAAAYFGAYWLKGDKLRVNQVEIIDIDAADGATRGRLVTHLFSPTAKRYDLSLAPKSLTGEPMAPTASGTAWLGKPTLGLGGMQSPSSSSNQSGVTPSYQIDSTPLVTGPQSGPTIVGMPVQVWSTKSLVSRYEGETDRVVDSQLSRDRDDLVEGSLTNDCGVRLSDCRLLYGTWAWKLGAIGDGETKTIDPSVSPVRISTLLGKIDEANPYDRFNRWTTIEAMGDALSVGTLAAGDGEAASRYLHDLDLAHHLAAGKAILLARVEDGPRSELVRPDGPLVVEGDDKNGDGEEANDLRRRSWVFVRFLLPVEE